jgi:hypothetical protein
LISKHVDLIAIAALLLAFAFAERLQEAMHLSFGQARLFRVRALNPIVIVPPHVPAVPRVPHLPRV